LFCLEKLTKLGIVLISTFQKLERTKRSEKGLLRVCSLEWKGPSGRGARDAEIFGKSRAGFLSLQAKKWGKSKKIHLLEKIRNLLLQENRLILRRVRVSLEAYRRDPSAV